MVTSKVGQVSSGTSGQAGAQEEPPWTTPHPVLPDSTLILRSLCKVEQVKYTFHVGPPLLLSQELSPLKHVLYHLGGGSQKLLENLIEALSSLPPILHMLHKVA